jgi:hypothetical protein
MESWVLQEFDTIHLGDKRLNNRSKIILSQLSKEPLSSIPSACKGWQETKAAYRYLDNEKVNSESLLAPHKEATLKRVMENKRVFVLQDTTLLDYSSQLHKQGVGPTYRGKEHALLLHPSLVVNEAGVCLSVYADYQWHHSAGQPVSKSLAMNGSIKSLSVKKNLIVGF